MNDYNVILFREIFLENLINHAVDAEETFMYRQICAASWKEYEEQSKEKK